MSVIELIGNTPLVELQGFDTGCCSLFVKLENTNPSGSIKDRIGRSMIEDAEQRGLLKPGGRIVEATAGNTGLGLALVAGLHGYPLTLVIPDKMSREKISHLRAMGAEVVLTRSDVPKGHPAYYHERAEEIARSTPGAWYANQFGNPANPRAHEETTGPEIWEQMEHNVDAVVCGVGSGGTITGLSRFFEKTAPQTEMVLADPVGSVLSHYIETGELLDEAGSWMVEGIGEDFIPPVADLSRCKKAYSILDKESLHTARELLSKNGIFGGSSSGTLIAAALRYCKEQSSPKRVVTFVCDTGGKYLSKMYNDYWMLDQGFIDRPRCGDLRDLISRLHEERATVTCSPREPLSGALAKMKMFEISQLPVLDGDSIVGIIDEGDILFAVQKDKKAFEQPVSSIMSSDLKILNPKDSIDRISQLLRDGFVAIIADEAAFYGIVTKMDFINYLRLSTE